MFTPPPHSSHLPHCSSTSSSNPGFPQLQAHSSGGFCTDFLSLVSRDWKCSQIYSIILFISIPHCLHPSLLLQYVGCECPIPAPSLASSLHSLTTAEQWSECLPFEHEAVWLYWVFLFLLPSAELKTLLGSSENSMLPSQLSVEMDLSLDSWIFSSLVLNVLLHQTPHSGAYLPLLISYLTATPQTWPLWSCIFSFHTTMSTLRLTWKYQTLSVLPCSKGCCTHLPSLA